MSVRRTTIADRAAHGARQGFLPAERRRALRSGVAFAALMAAGIAIVPATDVRAQEWIGTQDSDYNDPQNWSSPEVPDAANEDATFGTAGAGRPSVDLGGMTLAPDTVTIAADAPTYEIDNGGLDTDLTNLSANEQRIGATLSGTLTQNGSGDLALTANNILDVLTVDAGTLSLDDSTQTVSSFSGAGGTIDITGATANGSLVIDQGVDTEFEGDFAGAAAAGGDAYLVMNGTGTLLLSGTNGVTGPGRVEIADGTLAVSNGNSLGDGDVVDVSAPGTLELRSDETIGLLEGDGAVELGVNTLTLAGVDVTQTASSASIITGTGGLTVNIGDDTQILTGDSGFTGDAVVNSGTLSLEGTGAIDAGVVTVNGGTLASDGGALTTGAAVTVNDGRLDLNGSEDLGSGTVTSGSDGRIELAANQTLTAQTVDNGGTLVSDGTIIATVANDGTAEVAGSIEGNITNSDDGTFTATGTLGTTGDFNNSGTATLATGGNDVTISGTLTNSSAGPTPMDDTTAGVTVGAAGSLTAGTIDNQAGGTILNDGTLTANGTLTNAAGATLTSTNVLEGAIANSGTADLSGTLNGTLSNDGNGVVTITNDLNVVSTPGSAVSVSNSGNGVVALTATGGNLTTDGQYVNSSNGQATAVPGPNSVGTRIAAGRTLDAQGVSNSGRILVDGTLDSNAQTITQTAGTLVNNGTVIGTVDATGGTVQGTGTFRNGVTIADGATIGAGQVDDQFGMEPERATLTVDGRLDLDGTADFDLTQADTRTGDNDRLVVGSADLDGSTIDVGTIANGTYRLIESTGAIDNTDQAMLAGSTGRLYTTGNGTNLNVAVGTTTVQYFDGGDNEGDGTVDGGNGVWNDASTNWTSESGELNDSWQGDVAPVTGVFATQPGTVTLDGAQDFGGLRFDVDGYRIAGANGSLVANGTNVSTIEVAAGATATIDADIAGDTAMTGLTIGDVMGTSNAGTGTVVLTGNATYGGLTRVSDGTLRLGTGVAGSTASIAGSVDNDASFDVTSTGIVSGNLDNSGTATNAGRIATVSNSAGMFTNTGTVTGLVTATGGMVTNSSRFEGGANVGTGGDLTNDGTGVILGGLTNSGDASNAGRIDTVTNNAGMFTNTGRVTGLVKADGGMVTNSSRFEGGANVGTGGDLTNDGTGVILGGLTNAGDASNAGRIDTVTNNAGVFTNTGRVTATTDVNGGLVDNSGTLTGEVTVDMDGALETTGMLRAGLTALADATVDAEGTIAGAVDLSGNAAMTTTGNLSTPGTLDTSDTATFTVGQGVTDGITTLTNDSTARTQNNGAIESGGLNVSAGATLNANQIDNLIGATFVNEGAVNAPVRNDGTFVNRGTVRGNLDAGGTFANETGGDIIGTTTVRTEEATNAGELDLVTVNDGGVLENLTGGNISELATIEVGGRIDNSGILSSVNVAGTLNNLMGGDITGLTEVQADATATNAGTTGDVENAGDFTNAGIVGGTLENTDGLFTSAGTITGNVDVFGGTVIATGTTTFGENATVTVDGASAELRGEGQQVLGTLQVLDGSVTDGTFLPGSVEQSGGTVSATLDGRNTATYTLEAPAVGSTAPAGILSGELIDFARVNQSSGTITSAATVDTQVFVRNGGTSTLPSEDPNSPIEADLLVIADGSATAAENVVAGPARVEVENLNGDVTVVSDIAIGSAGEIAVEAAASGDVDVEVAALTGAGGVLAESTGGRVTVVSRGPIDVTGTAIDATGTNSMVDVLGDITASTAFESDGEDATFTLFEGSSVDADNILETRSGSATLLNFTTLDDAAFMSGPGRTTIVNSGTVNFSNNRASNFGGTADSFENEGTVVFGMATTPQIVTGLESFTNRGTIDLRNVPVGATDSFDDVTIADRLDNEDNAVIALDVDLRAGDSDTLRVNGTFTGDPLFRLTDVSDERATNFGETVLVSADDIESVGGTYRREIAGFDESGFIDMQVVERGDDIVLRSSLDADRTGAVVSNIVATQNAISNALFRPSAGSATAPVDPIANHLSFAPSFRTIGGYVRSHATGVARPTGIGPTEIETGVGVVYGGYQFGFDGGVYNINGKGGNVLFGINAGQTFAEAEGTDFNSSTSMRGYYGGLTASYFKGRFFADAQLRQEFNSYTIDAQDNSFRVSGAESDATRFTANISAGYAFSFGKWNLTPELGYAFSRTQTDDLRLTDAGILENTFVSFDDRESNVAIGSVALSRTFLLRDETLRVSPFASLTAFHDFTPETDAVLTVEGQAVSVSTTPAQTYGELSFGATMLTLTPKIGSEERLLKGSFRAGVQFGRETLGGSADFRLRLQF